MEILIALLLSLGITFGDSKAKDTNYLDAQIQGENDNYRSGWTWTDET